MKISFKTEKQKNPLVNDGFSVRYGPAKRFAFKGRWYFLLVLILSPLIIFAVHILNEQVLVNADGILTTNPIILNAPQTAYIEKINVRPGDEIVDQQVLVKMNSPLVEAELGVLSNNYQRIKTEHEHSLKELENLHIKNVKLFEENMASQKALSAEYSAYKKQGILPLQDKYLIAENNLLSLSRYNDAQIRYEQILIEHKSGGVAQTLFELEVALSKAKIKDEMLKIKAPKNAKVVEVLVEEGGFAQKGEPLISVSNLKKPLIHVYLDPKYMNYAQIGQTAKVTFPNGDQYIGIIRQPTQITKTLPSQLSGPFENNKPTIKVILDISPTPPVILEGMPVKVRFHYVKRKVEEE